MSKDVWRRKKNPGGTSTYKITPEQSDGKESLPRGLMPISPTSVGSQRNSNINRANVDEIKIRDKYGSFGDIAFGITEGETPSWKRNRQGKRVAGLLERYDELQGSDSVPDVIARKDLEIKLKARHPSAYQRYINWRKQQNESF